MKEDAISRSSTLEHVQRLDHLATLPDGDFVVRLSEVEDAIINGLPAQSQRMRGRWELSSLTRGPMRYCSECGFGQWVEDERVYSFCPNCGAQMENG